MESTNQMRNWNRKLALAVGAVVSVMKDSRFSTFEKAQSAGSFVAETSKMLIGAIMSPWPYREAYRLLNPPEGQGRKEVIEDWIVLTMGSYLQARERVEEIHSHIEDQIEKIELQRALADISEKVAEVIGASLYTPKSITEVLIWLDDKLPAVEAALVRNIGTYVGEENALTWMGRTLAKSGKYYFDESSKTLQVIA